MNMWQAVAVTLGCAAVVGIFGRLTPRVKQGWSQWRQRCTAKVAARKAAREHEKREHARQEKIAAAEAEGKVIAVSRRGHRPVEVTFSDGTRSYYFCGDWEAYTAAMRSGNYPLTRTFHTSPPPIE
ncbi:hypothetical protein ACIBJI_41965 [Nocardia sp. NPDC050408]|uniref:hypothetical protein n=1 Tax=Nocardia sp. NPDC050408 TaxID=3364319 RepID=UPI0037A7A3D6